MADGPFWRVSVISQRLRPLCGVINAAALHAQRTGLVGPALALIAISSRKRSGNSKPAQQLIGHTAWKARGTSLMVTIIWHAFKKTHQNDQRLFRVILDVRFQCCVIHSSPGLDHHPNCRPRTNLKRLRVAITFAIPACSLRKFKPLSCPLEPRTFSDAADFFPNEDEIQDLIRLFGIRLFPAVPS